MAVTDDLTKLKNRRYILARLTKDHSQSVRYNRPLSCIIFDIDNFKNVNDTYGHDAGDAVLKAVGNKVLSLCRSVDSLGRYGGEEFLMVLPETEVEGARKFAERIRVELENLRIPVLSGRELRVTASFGVASYVPVQGSTDMNIDALIKRTDEALYRAKERGRNRVEMA
jgi:two-component system, cell cycle response regulator